MVLSAKPTGEPWGKDRCRQWATSPSNSLLVWKWKLRGRTEGNGTRWHRVCPDFRIKVKVWWWDKITISILNNSRTTKLKSLILISKTNSLIIWHSFQISSKVKCSDKPSNLQDRVSSQRMALWASSSVINRVLKIERTRSMKSKFNRWSSSTSIKDLASMIINLELLGDQKDKVFQNLYRASTRCLKGWSIHIWSTKSYQIKHHKIITPKSKQSSWA